MPRKDKIRERWDETGSEDEDSASYNIPSPNVPSSGDDLRKPSPSQYRHEQLKRMLQQLPREPSDQEFEVDEGD